MSQYTVKTFFEIQDSIEQFYMSIYVNTEKLSAFEYYYDMRTSHFLVGGTCHVTTMDLHGCI